MSLLKHISPFTYFNNLSLKIKLLLMMLFLSFSSIGLLFFFYARAEISLITEIKRHTDELSAAIQISVEQMTRTDEEITDEKLKEYVETLKKKGIRDISILNNEKEIIASSNPGLIGKTLDIKGDKVKTSGNIQEYLTNIEGYRNYDILLPVVVGDEQLGYIHITMKLDDFANLLRTNHLKRLISTSFVFVIGIAVSIFLSMKYTQPIHKLVKVVQKVASGDLTETMEVKGRDEIGELNKSFNEMVKSLKEMREMEERLRKAEHLSKIGQLASGIAHEIRNPLNFVNLSIDHLRVKHIPDDPKDREEFNRIISNIKEEIQRLNSMVDNFLNYGKPVKLNIQMISLTDIIKEVIALADEKLTEQRIKIETNFNSDIQKIPADSQQIKTCFMNLIINAIQAMPNGGKIIINMLISNGSASIMVKDTGIGIEAENISKIFEPYFTTKESGIGLGLALTKRIVEEHGGSINIISEKGKGTVATIELPVVREVG